MFTALCMDILGTFSVIMSVLLSARLAGLFAIESFGNPYPQHLQNSIDTIKNNITCPLGIHLKSDNFAHLHK